MNVLHRTIEKNEVVVLKKSIFKPAYQSREERVVRVSGGFGMRSETMGTAIYCTFLSDGESCRYEGTDIDVTETDEYQQTFGKFGEFKKE